MNLDPNARRMMVVVAIIFGLMNGVFAVSALRGFLTQCPGGASCGDLRNMMIMGGVILAVCLVVIIRIGPTVLKEWRK